MMLKLHWIPEFLPSLHDRVLAAAADAASSISSNQKKKQGLAPGILGGIVRGIKGGKVDASATPESDFTHLENKFLKAPFIDTKDIELDIDDIEIDETPPVTSSSSHDAVKTKGGKESDREKLLGAPDDSTPKFERLKKSLQNIEKLEMPLLQLHMQEINWQREGKSWRDSRRTEELQSGAENFASLADELVKTMQNKKWWQI